MKKILPLAALLSTALVLTSCGDALTTEHYINGVQVYEYSAEENETNRAAFAEKYGNQNYSFEYIIYAGDGLGPAYDIDAVVTVTDGTGTVEIKSPDEEEISKNDESDFSSEEFLKSQDAYFTSMDDVFPFVQENYQTLLDNFDSSYHKSTEPYIRYDDNYPSLVYFDYEYIEDDLVGTSPILSMKIVDHGNQFLQKNRVLQTAK